MGRKKVSLQWIANNASRHATLNKRRQGLMKKTSELATLCGVKVCVLVYGDNEVRPELWPSVPEATKMLASYKATADVQQWNKRTSHENFLKKRIAKIQDQVRRSDYESQVCETTILFHECMAGNRPALLGVTPEEVVHLHKVTERKMKAVQERLRRLGIEPEQPRPLHQLPHVWSMIQAHARYTFTEMHRQAPEEEPQAHQQDTLVGMGGEQMGPGTIVSGAFTGNSGSADASTASTNNGGYGIV